MAKSKEELLKEFFPIFTFIKKNFPEDTNIIRMIEEGLKKRSIEDLILLLSPYFDSPKKISLDYKIILSLFEEGKQNTIFAMADKVKKRREIYRRLEKIIS